MAAYSEKHFRLIRLNKTSGSTGQLAPQISSLYFTGYNASLALYDEIYLSPSLTPPIVDAVQQWVYVFIDFSESEIFPQCTPVRSVFDGLEPPKDKVSNTIVNEIDFRAAGQFCSFSSHKRSYQFKDMGLLKEINIFRNRIVTDSCK